MQIDDFGRARVDMVTRFLSNFMTIILKDSLNILSKVGTASNRIETKILY